MWVNQSFNVSWVSNVLTIQASKLKAANFLVPGLPSRPTGPPSTVAIRSKWWQKWFLLAVLVTVGLTKRMKIFPTGRWLLISTISLVLGIWAVIIELFIVLSESIITWPWRLEMLCFNHRSRSQVPRLLCYSMLSLCICSKRYVMILSIWSRFCRMPSRHVDWCERLLFMLKLESCISSKIP